MHPKFDLTQPHPDARLRHLVSQPVEAGNFGDLEPVGGGVLGRKASAERTRVGKLRPSCCCIAASARRSSVARAMARESNTTLPLDSTVLTSVNPALSKQRLSSGIRAFIGLTPRRKAA